MISPRMYDSVKRLEPTCSVDAAAGSAATNAATKNALRLLTGSLLSEAGRTGQRVRPDRDMLRGAQRPASP